MNDFTLRKCYFIYFAKFESPIDLLFVVIFTPEASSIVLGIQTGWWFRKHYYPNPTILPVLSFVLGDGLEGTAGRVAGRLAVVARAPAAVQQDNRATVGKKQTQPSLSSNQLLSRTSRLGSSCESENGWKTSHGWQGLACRVLKWAVIAKWQSAAACRPSLLSVWQGGCQQCQVPGLLVVKRC